MTTLAIPQARSSKRTRALLFGVLVPVTAVALACSSAPAENTGGADQADSTCCCACPADPTAQDLGEPTLSLENVPGADGGPASDAGGDAAGDAGKDGGSRGSYCITLNADGGKVSGTFTCSYSTGNVTFSCSVNTKGQCTLSIGGHF